ncbi:MAG: glutamine amidotransferase family protein [Oscillospiraceae bacterium]|nr:glutamine amidotransferase family protein [Oscillospiraceae bacterium]
MRIEGKDGCRIPAGCAVSAIFSRSGEKENGERILRSIALMRARSNGLGGGFAAYGIYPEFAECYAFHLFYESPRAKEDCEAYLERNYEIAGEAKIPTRKIAEITDEPLICRYFVYPLRTRLEASGLSADDFVVRAVMHINADIDGAYIFSSGKNMGVFKGVGYPEDVGRFYRLETYEADCWTAHGRYPTNTPGWWGGAHPFAMLGMSVVHNGEISSYDANRRAIEMFGYKCSLLTDTEVIAYILDYLTRKQGFTLAETAQIIAAPFWSRIDRMEPAERARLTGLRERFGSLLVTGPFSVLVGFDGGIMALNDRLKLRSLVVAEKGDTVYMASEESAIRVVEPAPDKIFAPPGGEAVIYTKDREVG